MPMLGYTPFFIGLGLSLIAQLIVSLSFRRYNKVASGAGYSGFSTARRLLDQNGLSSVTIQQVAGNLTDHFSPREGIMRLSESTYSSHSIAAVSVAAHETGHAIQHRDGYKANKIRSALLLPANIGSMAGPYLAGTGLLLEGSLGVTLVQVGIAFFASAVLFYLITLPVEFDASRRAIILLEETGILAGDELKGARRVLRAAALTYVASALASVLYFFRLTAVAGSRRRR